MKNLDKKEVLAKAESNFLKVIVFPLWSLINSFFGDELSEQINLLNKNIKEWEKIAIEEEKNHLKNFVLQKYAKEKDQEILSKTTFNFNEESVQDLNTTLIQMNSSTTADELAFLSYQKIKTSSFK